MTDKAWWHPEVFARRRPALEVRARASAGVRAFFAERGFVEVETPCLQVSPGLDSGIQALVTEVAGPLGRNRRRLYLHTSPEFAMKKLLVAGVERLFQITHVWRNGERSPLHHPEFMLLEWYRAHVSYEALMEDCEGLLQAAASAAGVVELRHGARRCNPTAPARRLTIAEAFARYCGIDLLATTPDPHAPDTARLAEEARRIGLHTAEGDRWEDVFHRILVDRIESHLGDGTPTILCEYPVSRAALSRPSPRDPRVAERFELYVCGLELANAYSELTDPVEQRRRFEADQALLERLYGVRYPIDEDFLAALEAGMPESAGIALGLDRLVMLLAGADSIDDVLWAPVAE
ncbi:MAG TPA: EF-P lysine aminoacylase EpmA [Candidatus Methylomirabilis sp.]|nr:EF-P lysine aminoacylase EpmA [Candidatus Methylomirabilis sp.]